MSANAAEPKPSESSANATAKILLDEEQQQKIIARLAAVGATGPCLRCGNPHLEIQNGIVKDVLQDTSSQAAPSPGAHVSFAPLVSLVCKRCGFVLQHNLGILGFVKDGKIEI